MTSLSPSPSPKYSPSSALDHPSHSSSAYVSETMGGKRRSRSRIRRGKKSKKSKGGKSRKSRKSRKLRK